MTVRSVEIKFKNKFDFFMEAGKTESEIEAALSERLAGAAGPLMLGRNGIFSINRAKVEDAIQAEENRIIVTNIEYIFPSRYVITIRERYPVFKLKVDTDRNAILCGYLRVLEVLNDADFAKLEQTLASNHHWPMIDITDQVYMDAENLDALCVKDELPILEPENEYIDILKQLTPVFMTTKTNEDALCSIFASIYFDNLSEENGGTKLVMTSRSGSESKYTHFVNHFVLEVNNADRQLPLKLLKGMAAVEYFQEPLRYSVQENATATDGIAVVTYEL